jgi:hypothetical protein
MDIFSDKINGHRLHIKSNPDGKSHGGQSMTPVETAWSDACIRRIIIGSTFNNLDPVLLSTPK